MSTSQIPSRLTKQFTREQLKEYRETFNLFDKDQNGFITTKEVQTVLRSLGRDPSRDEVVRIIKEHDTNGDGTIEFLEFLEMLLRILQEKDTEEDLVDVFRVVDQDGDGYISKADLHEVIIRLGIRLTDQELDEMIFEADGDGDGNIGFEEFAKIATE